ncbi:hypothetical protein BH23ACT7_BH23ACT7_20480 [soil metagenome]|jgi:nickel-type superoxide dismutase maturation protease
MGWRRIRVGLACAAALAWLVARRFGRVAVTGSSMAPALLPGDRLLLVRTRRLRPGDLAVVRDPRQPRRSVVKRVAAVGADGAVDVRGDNAAASTDSRTWGPVPPDLVVGRVRSRYFPPARSGRVAGEALPRS